MFELLLGIFEAMQREKRTSRITISGFGLRLRSEAVAAIGSTRSRGQKRWWSKGSLAHQTCSALWFIYCFPDLMNIIDTCSLEFSLESWEQYSVLDCYSYCKPERTARK